MMDSQKQSSTLLVSIGMGIGMVAGSMLTRYFVGRKQPQEQVKTSLASRPSYKPGQTPSLPTPNFGKSVEIFDPSKLKSCYNLIISTVTPRPIALVSSRNPDTGIDNVSPFSYFGAVAHDPPMLAIGFCRKGPDAKQKDSLFNILQAKTFGVHIISEWYLDAANHSCGNFDPDVDEFEVSGMTKITDDVQVSTNASRVKEAAIMYECQLEYVHPVKNDNTGKATTEIILARILRIHVDKEVLVDNYDPLKPAVDTMKLKPIGRLGGNIYSTIGETVDIPRPKVS